MMNKEESIKIVIMRAFEQYKNLIDFDEQDFDLLKKMDNCETIKELEECINCKEFYKIKKILVSEEFNNQTSAYFNDDQLKFLENIKTRSIQE